MQIFTGVFLHTNKINSVPCVSDHLQLQFFRAFLQQTLVHRAIFPQEKTFFSLQTRVFNHIAAFLSNPNALPQSIG